VNIVGALFQAGWQQSDIDDTFRLFDSPVSVRDIPQEISQAESGRMTAPRASRVITEREYPITLLWVFKYPIIIITVSIIGLLFGYWFPDLLFALPILPVYMLYKRKKITFAIGQHTLQASGVFQQRKNIDTQYSAIVLVNFHQDFFDMIFGLGEVNINLVSKRTDKNGLPIKKPQRFFTFDMSSRLNEDNFSISGVTKENGEILESIILDRIQNAASVGQGVAAIGMAPEDSEQAAQALQRYVDAEIRVRTTPESLRATLLARGWLSSEIEVAMAHSGVTGVINTKSVQVTRKNWVAIVSIPLFIFGVGAYFLNGFVAMLCFFSGFVFGIIGVRSNKKWLAITGIVLNTLALLLVSALFAAVFYVYTTGNAPFGKHFTEQEWVNLGFPVEKYK